MKECFSCNKDLERALLYNIEVDYCPQCQGVWFDEDELRQAKDKKDENLKWLDVDLGLMKRSLEYLEETNFVPLIVFLFMRLNMVIPE